MPSVACSQEGGQAFPGVACRVAPVDRSWTWRAATTGDIKRAAYGYEQTREDGRIRQELATVGSSLADTATLATDARYGGHCKTDMAACHDRIIAHEPFA